MLGMPPEKISVDFFIPGDLSTPTGGYEYARRLIGFLPALGTNIEVVSLEPTFPNPTRAALDAARRAFRTREPDVFLVDGLAFGALPGAILRQARRPVVALVHHPLGLESGIPMSRARSLIRSETEALKLARAIITTSQFTADLLVRDFQVPADKIAVAQPGTVRMPRIPVRASTPVRLLAVGAVSVRKGYDTLVSALAKVRSLPWHLTIVGSLERSPDVADRLRAQIDKAGLAERILLAGAVSNSDLERLFECADLFVSASLFEGYGMVLAEAMARGLPIVASTGGAAQTTIPDDAALKFDAGDVDALAHAIARLLSDVALRRLLGERAWNASRTLPTWERTAAVVSNVLKDLRGA